MLRKFFILVFAALAFPNLYLLVEQYMDDGSILMQKALVGGISFVVLFLLMEGKKYKEAFDEIIRE